VWRLHLTGAQEGLVLTVTSKDCLVHWSGTGPQNNNTRLVEEDITLPYQEGSALHDTNTPTEVVSSTTQDLIDFRVTSYQQVDGRRTMQADYWKTYELWDLRVYSCMYTDRLVAAQLAFSTQDQPHPPAYQTTRFNYLDLTCQLGMGSEYSTYQQPTTRLRIPLLGCGDWLLSCVSNYSATVIDYSATMFNYLDLTTKLMPETSGSRADSTTRPSIKLSHSFNIF
jgi:hypothetical protein